VKTPMIYVATWPSGEIVGAATSKKALWKWLSHEKQDRGALWATLGDIRITQLKDRATWRPRGAPEDLRETKDFNHLSRLN